MTKTVIAALLVALGLVACSSAGPSAQDADTDYLYGRHAGKPMRDAPDGSM